MVQNYFLALHYSNFASGVVDSFSCFMINFFRIQLTVSKTKMMPALAAWIYK